MKTGACLFLVYIVNTVPCIYCKYSYFCIYCKYYVTMNKLTWIISTCDIYVYQYIYLYFLHIGEIEHHKYVSVYKNKIQYCIIHVHMNYE